MSYTDVSGQPRSKEDIEAAIKFLTHEVVARPLALSPTGFPLAIHYTVIRDALRELLTLRAALADLRSAKETL